MSSEDIEFLTPFMYQRTLYMDYNKNFGFYVQNLLVLNLDVLDLNTIVKSCYKFNYLNMWIYR